jgi:hypothetical protein
MPESVFGLPVHPLAVHATVVLVPLAALALLAHVLVPAARRRLGVVTPVLALVALVLVPISTASGEDLEHRLPESPLIERHAALADGMLPWALALAVMAVAVYALDRARLRAGDGVQRAGRPRGGLAARRWVGLLATVLAVVAVAGIGQQVVRVGHSGATATWSEVPGARSGPNGSGGDQD